jgi:hypothetical protein
MGIFDDLTGKTAANASRAAAADTYSKQQKAYGDLLGYGDEYASNMSSLYQPYANTGAEANSALARLLADPSSLRSLPGYQFAQEEGVQALDRSAAARGMLGSGRQSKDLLRFGTGLADQTYGNQFARLMSGAGLGMNATQGQAQGLQGQLGARQTAYGGMMNAAGTIGQGDIAAANARSAGIQNLFNTGANLAGKAMGGGFGGFGGGGFQTVGFDSYGNPNYGRV